MKVEVIAGTAITSPRCPALKPNSDSRCTGMAVRNSPKISMKMTKPMLTEPITSRWRIAEPAPRSWARTVTPPAGRLASRRW